MFLFIVIPLSVRIATSAIQNFGRSLTLTCVVFTLRGITSRVTITWLALGDEVRRVDNVIGNVIGTSVSYRDQLNISSLTSDGSYTCRAIINSTTQDSSQDVIRLVFTCTYT